MADNKDRTYDDFSKNAIYNDSDSFIGKNLGWNESLPGDDATPLSASNLNAMLDMLISIRDKLGKTKDFKTTFWESTEIKINDSVDSSDPKTVAAYINALVAEIKAKVDSKVDKDDLQDALDSQQIIDDEQDRRLGVIESDYLKAADIANFETKENVKKVADDLSAYVESNDAAVANRYTKQEANDKFVLIEDAYDDTALSTRVKAIEDDYLKANDKTGLTSLITEEQIRAEAAEIDLLDKIRKESTRAKNVEANLDDRLDAISTASGGFIEANSLPVTLDTIVFNRIYKIPTYRWVTKGDANQQLKNVFTLDEAVGKKVIPVDAQVVGEFNNILISEYLSTPFNDTGYQDPYYYLTRASGAGDEYRICYHWDGSWVKFDGETSADIISINDFAGLGDDRYQKNYIVSYPDEYDLYYATECSDGKIFWKHLVDDNLLDLKIAEISRYDINESKNYTDSMKSQLENKLTVVSSDLNTYQAFAENTYLKNDQALYGDQAVYKEENGEYRCIGLSADNINITELTILGSYNNCPVIIPAGQTGLGSFGTNTTLTKIIIKDGITHIPDYCFTNYTGLTEVILPESIISIGKYAFYKCTNLKHINLPDTIQTIGNSAFAYCSALTEIYLPRDLDSLGASAFASCKGCTDLILGSTEMCRTEELSQTHRIFDYLGDQTAGVTLTIKSNVERICERFLNGNINVESWHPHVTNIIFEPGSKCSEIGQKAFYNNYYLTQVTIPASVTTIGDYAFSSTPNLIICCEASSKQPGWSTSWNSGTDTYYRGTSNAPGLFRSEWIAGTLTVNPSNTSVSFSDYPSGLPQGIYLTWIDVGAASCFGIISNAGNQVPTFVIGDIGGDFYNNKLTINATNISSIQVARLL